MKIPQNIKMIEVYYDGRCGLCCTFQEWLQRQKHQFTVRTVAYQSAQAEEWFPRLRALDPGRSLMVRTDTGALFRGAEGWVMCLLACDRYQLWARQLAHPQCLPLTEKVCHLLAAKRYELSKWCGLKQRIHVTGRGLGYQEEERLIQNIPDGII